MYKLRVENTCRCFIKGGFAEIQEFSTKEEVKKEAKHLIGVMRNTFCQKHEFVLSEQFGDFTIYIKPRS